MQKNMNGAVRFITVMESNNMKTSKKLNILDVLIAMIIVVVGFTIQPLPVHARTLHDDGPISSSSQPGPLDLESVDLISQNGYIEQIGQMGDLVDVTAIAVGDDNQVYYADGTTFKIAVMSTVNRLEELGSLKNMPGVINEIAVANGYAFLLIESQGLWVIDISKPAAPIIISSLPLTDVRRLAIKGDYAYVLSSNTFATLDISDVTTLKQVATISLYNDGDTLLLDTTYAYLTTYNGLAIVDLSNPRTPRRVGGITLENTSTTSLVVAEDMAYLATWYGKIYVVNIANRTQPVLVTSVQEEKTPNSQYTLAFFGSYLYLIGGTLFATYDIATPDSPIILQKQTLSWDRGFYLKQAVTGNQYIFLAEGYFGLTVYDLHNPATPTQVRSNLAGDLAGISGIASLDHWLYVINDGALEVYDCTDPLSLKLISRIVVPGYASDLWRAEDRLYLKVTPGSKLLIFDLAVPNRPSLIGEVALPFDLRELTVRRNAVYGITWTTTNNLLTFDTTIASAPVQLSTIELPWNIDTLSTDSDYLFTSGIEIIDGLPRGAMSIYDVASSVAPSKLGSYTSPLTTTYDIGTVTTVESFAYFRASGGLEVINIANSSAPKYVGNPQGEYSGPPVYFGNSIFISGQSSYLSLIEIGDPVQPVIIDTISVPSGARMVGDFPDIFYTLPMGLRIFRYLTPENAEVPISGTSWTTSDGVKYSFSSNIYTQSLPIEHISHYAQPLDLPPNAINLGHFFELRPRAILTETMTPFSITVPYDNIRLGDDRYSVGLYRLTENGWSVEETSFADQQTGVVSITTNRFGSWALLAEYRPVSLTWHIYLPLALRPAPDLRIRNIELTQAIQDPKNSVAIVENRPTLLRVFADVSGTAPVDGIRIAVSGYHEGTLLPGSPIQVGPLSVFPKPLRSNLGDSFNVLLPQDWLSGEIDIKIVVDATNVLSESDESNNEFFQHVAFKSIPPLDVMIVPVNLTNLMNGVTCKWSPVDFISDRVMRTFPVHKVNIQYHAPISVSIAGTEPEPLIPIFNAVRTVKQSEELPYGVVYYGVVLGAVINETSYQNCLTGYFRYVGIGGGRVGVSFDMTPWPGELSSSDHVAAHELGHALGRPHTFQDPNYPYPDDSIGQYGIDIGLMQLHSPILPGNAKDFMSYQRSDLAWVSDYMYVGMLNDQIRYGVTNRIGVANNRVIMLRATLLDSEHASVQPIYVFTGTNKLGYEERGDYSAEVFDQDDKLIGVYPLDLVQVYGESEDLFTLGANLSFTSSTLSKVRIKLKDEVIGERKITNQVATGGLGIQKTVQDLVLTWDQPELPALVQYSNDDGSTWVTLGVDVYGGVFHVDPTDLPGGKVDFRLTLADLVSPTSWIATYDQRLPNTTPQVWVTGPSALKADQPLLLFGHGADREDGIIENISWLIDGELIDVGQIFQISSLSPGQHVITATVQDKDGVRSTATHTITVESGSVFDSRSEQ